MKTNLANLMSIVDEEEKKFNEITISLKRHAFSTSIQELDGTVNVTQDYQKDFLEEYQKVKEIHAKISNYKAIIYQKNNEFKLSDGRSIQEAIVDNTYLRKMKEIYSYLVSLRSSKERETEVHNSYFVCNNLNYDVDTVKKEYEEVEKKIQETDFEISKLNSIEFEI